MFCGEPNQVQCIIKLYVKRSQVFEFYVYLITATGPMELHVKAAIDQTVLKATSYAQRIHRALN